MGTNATASDKAPNFASPFTIRGRAWVGWLGLALAPGSALLDTANAVASGWRPHSSGGMGMIAWLPPAALGFTLAVAILPAGRRCLRRYDYRLLALGVAITFGWLISQQLNNLLWPVAAFHCRPALATYHFRPSPYLMPGIEGDATQAINSVGLRGSELPARNAAHRILCVGGGTTECCYLDDGEAWPAQLQQQLSAAGQHAWVGSAGYGDYASGHHLRFLRESPLAAEMDCIVILVGANDLIRRLLGMDLAAHPGPLWSRSPSMESLQQFWNVTMARGYVCDPTGERWLLLRSIRDIRPPTADLAWDVALDEYGQRISGVVAAAKRRGVRLVFVSQPTLWGDFLTHGGYRKLVLARTVPYPREWDLATPSRLRDLMDRYNAKLIATCGGQGVECIDAAATLAGNEQFYYDDDHLNESGCRELGRLIAAYFAEHALARREPD